MPFGRSRFALTPPSWPVFIVALVLGIAALIDRYTGISVPYVTGARVFHILAAAYVLLVVGVLVRRL